MESRAVCSDCWRMKGCVETKVNLPISILALFSKVEKAVYVIRVLTADTMASAKWAALVPKLILMVSVIFVRFACEEAK